MDTSKKQSAVPTAPAGPMVEEWEKLRAALLEASASTDAQSSEMEARLLEVQRRLMAAIPVALATRQADGDGTKSS